MIKAGILTSRIDKSQSGFQITKCINDISLNKVNVDIMVFVREFSAPPMVPLFSTLQESEVWGFDAPVIATDLQTASTLINTTGPTKKYFYVWDLEWMRINSFKHKTLSKIYNNKNLELIARSERHSKIIENCWRKPSHIMQDFSSDELLEIIKKWQA